MDGQFDFARALKLIQFEAAPAALAFDRIARIRQGLQFAENKSRHNQRPAEKTGRAKIGDAAIDNHIGVDDERLALRRFAGEADIRNDEGEFIAAAAHGQHHAEISESGNKQSAARPIASFRIDNAECPRP